LNPLSVGRGFAVSTVDTFLNCAAQSGNNNSKFRNTVTIQILSRPYSNGHFPDTIFAPNRKVPTIQKLDWK
jgi:hypothetical protein